jgi:circadian clock protein KaiC
MLEQLAPEYGSERRRLRVIKLRGSHYRGGFHDFVIKTGGLDVYPRLVAADHHQDFKHETVSGGVPALDTLLGGGLDRGTSTLIMGPAGCGKSSIAAQFVSSAAKRGESCAAFIFDEGINIHLARAAGLGNDLRGEVDAGRIKIQQVDPAELSPGEFVYNVRRAVERDGVRFVVIDSLNGYMQAMPDERHLTIQMHELLTYLNQQGVVTILVMAQHGLVGNAMVAPVDVSYLADTVMLLRYFEVAGAVRRSISVVKKRSGFHEDTIRELRLSSRGIEVGEPLSEFHGVLTGVPTYSGKRRFASEEDDA